MQESVRRRNTALFHGEFRQIRWAKEKQVLREAQASLIAEMPDKIDKR